MAVTIRIPGVYYKGIHVVVCKLGPPDVWYRGGGEIKKKNKKERANRSQLNPDCVIVCRRRML